jgi:hypothetical protein
MRWITVWFIKSDVYWRVAFYDGEETTVIGRVKDGEAVAVRWK